MLLAQPLTREAFAPFGDVIGPQAPADLPARPVNAGTALRHEALAALDLGRDGGRAVLAIYDARARVFPLRAEELERHRLSDQVFLPMGAALRAVLLVAPADGPPSPQRLRAFVSDGRQGVRLRAGTWHHALLALDEGPWAVLERRAEAPDCELFRLEPAVSVALPA